ncbi:L-methionine/branched-chain amino acid transporter [Vibrio parahaemolyticus]|uniref:L-methionine/branched-chain amino acid transporter n=1 Tax=Vibrio parahaemolyticus TaxID=670 RepID=UPI00186A2306|nr:L-methionine/branched-chain amino acid transporter [Vibrio parahaemolyticus]EGQ8180126.1 L-methionine/branched-chain amino acid transporter [Vibrio parahaemolyticus]EHD6030643.1 L-methionine/branched-chain amino acid transporter [Vibrio parahaemolyticus]EHJ9986421.1 L-methionine/branched-chain amino acid transporter [Vibrio parahaemolyticus]EJA3096532.1 L-methionine/branched-chain amino acid transporter [Vibrio parahaemolyticus]EJR0954730.1 L-methionine/branched-chain amino acid transporter
MEQLKKDISLISGIAQLSTTLMGTGLFMIPAIAAGIAGHFSLWAWVLLFIAICPIALTFAQLGKRYPNAGGTAFFVRQAFNSRLESSVAWLFVSVIPVGVPAAIALAAGFLQQLLPTPINNHLFAQVLTVFLLILVNLSGTKSSGRLQTVIALSVFALVGAFLFKGEINSADLSMPTLTTESIWPITAALGVMFWCFVGIEAFAHMGEEFKNPQRDFPIAIIVGCFVAGATYWACSVVILKFGAYGSAQFDNASIPWLSAHLLGDSAKWLISIIGFSACFASVNLYTQSLSRMVWAQAREHRPTSPLAKISRRGVPSSATVLVGAVLLASCVIGSFSKLDLEFFLKLANSIFVLVYLLAMLAAYKLLHGLGKALAAISLVLCTGVFICLGWSMLYALGIFALLSLPWKQWRQKRHSSIVE